MSLIYRTSSLSNAGIDLIKGSPLTYTQLDGNFASISASLAARPQLQPGPGIVITNNYITASLRTVNGISPSANGNVAIQLASVGTGTLATRPVTAVDGSIYIVSGDPAPANNGDVYIYSTASGGWLQIAPLDQAAADARYLQLAGGTMQGNIDMDAHNLNNVGTIYAQSATVDGTPTFNNGLIRLVGGGGNTLFGVDTNTATRNIYTPDASGTLILSVNSTGSDGLTGNILLSTVPTASYVSASRVWGPYGTGSVATASYALTASYLSGVGSIDTSKIYSGSTIVQTYSNGIVLITGSAVLTTKVILSGSLMVGPSQVSGINAVAIGNATSATASGSLAQGTGSIASGNYAHAQGYSTLALGPGSHAEGYNTTSSGDYSHAEGYTTLASGSYSHAEGQQTIASGSYSHAEGYSTIAQKQFSHAEGQQTTTKGFASHAEGITTLAQGIYSHAEGTDTVSFGISAHAEGRLTLAFGDYSHAEGASVTSSGDYSHAEGNGSITYGQSSHAEGYYTIASASYSHAEGGNAIASGSYSHAEGGNTIARGDYSHAEGSNNTASGSYSHAEGSGSIAVGAYSHAEGIGTLTYGTGSHAEGYGTTAQGIYSHAEGYQATAYGARSHAEGINTVAYGSGSHAEGGYTVAFGTGSHAEGFYTIASGSYQTVVGQYNKRGNVGSLFVIGGGSGDTDANRKDVVNVTTTGMQITGSLIVSSSSNALTSIGVSTFTGSVSVSGSVATTGSMDLTGSLGIQGSIILSGSLTVSGSALVRNTLTASAIIASGSTGTVLSAIGSGSALFTVNGSQGQLFSVTDTLSGSLFSVNDISGLPILEVFSDQTTLIGSYTAPALNTTVRKTVSTGTGTVIYQIPTASYDGAWFEYTARSGSVAKVGTIMTTWYNTSFATVETTSSIGTATAFTMSVFFTGSYAALSGSTSTAGWTVKTIIRSI